MHKNELIRQVSEETGVSRGVAAKVINAALETIAREVAQGQRVVLTGFGAFEVRTRRERHGVDPRTATDILVPATRTPGFTASASFKARLGAGTSEQGTTT